MKGKRRQHGADFKARVALAALKGDKTINEVAVSVTMGVALDRYLENRRGRVAKSTFDSYVHIKRSLETSFGTIEARLLNEEDWERHVQRRKKDGVKPATRNRELMFLKGTLRHCKGLSRDILGDVEKEPEPPPGSMAHEYTAESAPSGWGLTFLAETTKRKLRTRWIPLSDPAIRAVREQTAESLRMGSPYLFPARRHPETHISGSAVDEFWKSVRTRTGIKGRIHDFRHTFITLMLMKGCSAETVPKMVGHTSTIMIHRVYGHLFRGHREDMVEAIRGRLSASAGVGGRPLQESPAASRGDKSEAIH